MKRLKTYSLLIYLFFLQLSFSQKVSDSIYNAATLSVYDNPDKAIEVGARMLEEYEKEPKRQIDALLLLSNAYSSKREYERSLDYANKARELTKNTNDLRSEISVLNKIAAQYHQLGIYDKALQYLDESDKIIAAYPNKDSISMILGNNYGVRGFIYRDQLSCDIAIDYFNRSMGQFKIGKENSKKLANMSVITYNKGNCFITLAQTDSARINFEKSLQYAQKADAKSLEAFSRKGIAEVYTLSGKYKEAITELNIAAEISKNVGDQVLNQGIYKALANNYLAINNWELYQEFYNKFLETERQNKNEERKAIGIALSRHSNEVDSKKNNVKSNYKMGIIVSTISIFIFVIIIILGQLKFRKQFRKLKQQLNALEKE